MRKLLGKLNIAFALFLAVLMTGGLGGATYVLASPTSSFTQTINAGVLSTDIVDGSYVTVASPTFAMNATSFSWSCQTVTGSFGSTTPSTQQIYVVDPSVTGNWTLALAASNPTDVWATSTPYLTFDFNDPAGDGCTGGQMTVDPSGAIKAQGQYEHGVSGISLGSSFAFNQGTKDSITLMTSDGTTFIGDWTLKNVNISQKIPAEQAAGSNYSINMVLSVSSS